MMENDLISRSALLEESEYFSCYNPDCEDTECEFSFVYTVDVRNAPAVDAVEVVRCKDCKWYSSYGRTSLLVDGKNIKAGWCQRRVRYDEEYRMLPGDFCSYGKRRNDV